MPTRHTADSSPEYLTPVIYHTLLVLSAGPRHGYAISQEVEALTDGRVSMGPGTLYGTLQRLSEYGWLERTEAVEAEGPHAGRRRYYALTPTGRDVLRTEAERLASAVHLAEEHAVLPTP
jgi:DNA-binding PadR family transcriptional regulator